MKCTDLATRQLLTLQPPLLPLLHPLLLTKDLVCGAAVMTAASRWPGTAGEAATEAMLGVGALLVVREEPGQRIEPSVMPAEANICCIGLVRQTASAAGNNA